MVTVFNFLLFSGFGPQSCSILIEVCQVLSIMSRYVDIILEMSQLSFNHLLNLSFGWHTHRKTGEILRVLDRGAAINHTLEVSFLILFAILRSMPKYVQLILFNIVPTFIDILIALVAFCVIFKWTLGLVLFFVMFAYGL